MVPNQSHWFGTSHREPMGCTSMARWTINGTTDTGQPAVITVSTAKLGVTLDVQPPGQVTISPSHIDDLRAALGHARDEHQS